MRSAASSASEPVPKKLASAVTRIRNGNIEISTESAMWLAIAQPSCSDEAVVGDRSGSRAWVRRPATAAFLDGSGHGANALAAQPASWEPGEQSPGGLQFGSACRPRRDRGRFSHRAADIARDGAYAALHAGAPMSALTAASTLCPIWPPWAGRPLGRAANLVAEATRRVRAKVVADGRISAERLESEQHAAHGLAWLATYAEGVRELAAYAERAARRRAGFGETEELLVRIGLGEYLDQIFGGIPMSQGEIVRLAGARALPARDAARFRTEAVETLIAERQHAGEPRPARRADRGSARRGDGRRRRPRRDARGDPRRDAPLRRGGGRAARPRLAPRERLHPARGHRARWPSSASSG